MLRRTSCERTRMRKKKAVQPQINADLRGHKGSNDALDDQNRVGAANGEP